MTQDKPENICELQVPGVRASGEIMGVNMPVKILLVVGVIHFTVLIGE